jgi:hypothetical protein
MDEEKKSKGYGLVELLGGVIGSCVASFVGSIVLTECQIRQHGFKSLEDWQSKKELLNQIIHSKESDYSYNTEAYNKARFAAKAKLEEIANLDALSDDKKQIILLSTIVGTVLIAGAINQYRNESSSKDNPQNTIESENITYDDTVVKTASQGRGA